MNADSHENFLSFLFTFSLSGSPASNFFSFFSADVDFVLPYGRFIALLLSVADVIFFIFIRLADWSILAVLFLVAVIADSSFFLFFILR